MVAMVRKFALAVALATPMLACAEDSYLKLGVGRSGYDYGSPFRTEHETGYLLAYGAMADSNWGAEVGYVDFGSNRVLDLDDNPSRLKVRALYVAGIAAYPLSRQAALYGKLGLAVKRYSVGSRNDTNTSALLGVGARWNFSRDWGAALEYTHYGKNDGLTLGQVSLSALYSF